MMYLQSLASAVLVLALPGFQAAAAQTARPYTLSVKTEGRYTYVSLKADKARLSDVAQDLGTRLHAKVVVGPGVQNETITVNLAETALDQALQSLAPRVWVDYEIRQDVAPVPLGIYLMGATDPAPPSDTVVRGLSQGFLIEGNTEDIPKKPEEDPLRVIGDRRSLTVVSRKQPLALVARAIGETLGIPVEIKGEGTEIIDVNLSNGLPEETVTSLSPNTRLYVRVDVNLGERTPLKLVVEKPAAK